MKIKNIFALITTDKLLECRDFYVKHFGFIVIFESTVYIQLRVTAPNGASYEIAFMPPNQIFGGDYRERFNGKGLYLTIEVADAKTAFEKLKSEGVTIIDELKNEPWGQNHFLVKDPNGTTVDVSEPTEPTPGWYDQYQIKKKQ